MSKFIARRTQPTSILIQRDNGKNNCSLRFEICAKGNQEGGGEATWFYFYPIGVLFAQCCIGGLPANALWVIRAILFSIRRRALSVVEQKYFHDEVIFGEKGISQLTPLLITDCPPNPSIIIPKQVEQEHKSLFWLDKRWYCLAGWHI